MTTETTSNTMMILYDSPRGFANEYTLYLYDAADPAQSAIAADLMERHRDRQPGDPTVMYTEPVDDYERRVYGRKLPAHVRADKYLPLDMHPLAGDDN